MENDIEMNDESVSDFNSGNNSINKEENINIPINQNLMQYNPAEFDNEYIYNKLVGIHILVKNIYATNVEIK